MTPERMPKNGPLLGPDDSNHRGGLGWLKIGFRGAGSDGSEGCHPSSVNWCELDDLNSCQCFYEMIYQYLSCA